MKKKMTLMLVLALIICTMPVMAKVPKNGRYIDKHGFIYIMRNGKPRTGYFRYHGKWYYGHKTAGRYPKGAVTQGEIRRKDASHWYAYDDSGKRIDKDWYARKGKKRILELDIRSRNKTVRYIYGVSRCTTGTRYSTTEMRMQEAIGSGRWRTMEGMQFLPEYVDTQK